MAGTRKSAWLEYPRRKIGALECIIFLSTIVFTVQVGLLYKRPLWLDLYDKHHLYDQILLIAGPLSFFGSIGLVIWRNSVAWSASIFVAAVDCALILLYLRGLAISNIG